MKTMDLIMGSEKLNNQDKIEIDRLYKSLKEKHEALNVLSDNITKIRANILNLKKLQLQKVGYQKKLVENILQIEKYDNMIKIDENKLHDIRELFLKDVYILDVSLKNFNIQKTLN